MIRITMMSAAFAIAALSVPVSAQTGTMGGGSQTSQNGSGSMTQGTGTMGSGSMGAGDMQSGAMADGSMGSTAPKMTRAQMASMKRCQAMPAAKMTKNKSCMKMQQMHPEMMISGT